LRALLSFFTVYPVGRSTLEKAAASAYLLPLVGLMTGLPGAAVLLGLGSTLPAGVLASLALAATLLAAGFHHTDGLLDVGDALMVRNGPERRREVMKDLRVGAGGVAAVLVVYAPAFAAISAMVAVSPVSAALALLAAETASRSTMVCLLVFGEPAEAGSSSAPFVAALRSGWGRYAGLALALVLPVALALPLGYVSLLTLVWLPAAGGALWVSARAFGGIGGDVSGATGEAVRTVVLVALSAAVA
jgi:adenosylcobinamide-GDP ribazoletransferase